MEAIAEYKRLIKLRPDPSFWDDNIIKAHTKCTNEDDHKLFYLFLCTPPEKFNPGDVKNMRTLGDRMKDPNFESGIQELPDELTQDIYKNGNEVVIRTRRKETPPQPTNPEQEDEKNP